MSGMGRKLRRCCVPGCRDRFSRRHAITTDPRYRPIWLERINNERLFEEGVKFFNFKICHMHFKDSCFDKKGAMRTFALPTLNLPDYRPTGDGDDFFKFSVPPPPPDNIHDPLEKLQKAIAAIQSSKSNKLCRGSKLSVIIPKKVYGKARNDSEQRISEDGKLTEERFSLKKSVTTNDKGSSSQDMYIECTPAEFEKWSRENDKLIQSPPKKLAKLQILKEDTDRMNTTKPNTLQRKRSKPEDNISYEISDSDSEDESRLQRIIRLLEEKLNNVISENDQLRAQNEKLKKENDELRSSQETINKNVSKTFTSGQVKALSNPDTNKKWNSNDIATALILESISPKAYRYLLNVRNMPLPSVSILRKWVARTSFDLDELTPMMKVIRYKRKSFSDDTMATVLCLQDINISKSGQSCQIVMARGLFKSWSQPVYCAYNTMITKDLLLLIITELHNVGFTVVAVVYDLSLVNNICEGSNYLTQCWFEHPVERDLKVFAFADPRYLLNMLRDHFINSVFNINGHKINKNMIKKILQINSEELNISKKHISSQNLNDIKLAEELFSSDVADVLDSYSGYNLPYAEAAKMVKIINEWYNLFQRNIDNGFGSNLTFQNDILNDTTKLVKIMKVDDSKMNDCLRAIISNNKSLSELYTYLQQQYKFHIPTKNLNRDVIDDLLFYVSPMLCEDNQDDSVVKSRFTDYIIGCVFSVGSDFDDNSSVKVSGKTECIKKIDRAVKVIDKPDKIIPFEKIFIKTETVEVADS